MAAFMRVFLTGYYNPSQFAAGLRDAPAPHWGFSAQLIRALLDAFILYFPLYLMGYSPPTPSYLPFFSTENYFGALVLIAPIVLTTQWLLGSSLVHVVLRLSGRHTDFDQILNINGMATLVVGAFVVVWDWAWMLAGGMNQYILGTSHLVIDIWGGVLTIVGMKKLLGVPIWMGILLFILVIAVALPLAVMFMRSPI